MQPPRQHPPRPSSPTWDSNRPYLTGAFLQDPPPHPPPTLSTYPENTQHALAAEDALNALLAVRPSYASISPGEPVYILQNVAAAHPEIAPLLARILPLATHHAGVKAFIEASRLPHRGSGYVRQAVSVALSELLVDYNAFVLRLETSIRENRLSLQKLLYYVQPTSRSMAILRNIANSLQAVKGGAALHRLYNLAVSHVGTDEARHVLAFVLGHAAAPIFDATQRWIRTGVVQDPYAEFFIVQNVRLGRSAASFDKSWDMRCTVNNDNLPKFLAPFIEKILRAGKYLNVLRECGVNTTEALVQAEESLPHVSPNKLEGLSLSGTDLLAPDAARRIAAIVDRSYVLASSALMQYLEKAVRIRERLRSLRRFFLMQQGDYLVHFFDAAGPELAKKRSDVSRRKLSSLLDLSIRTSVSALDEFQDDLTCTLCTEDLVSQISAIFSTDQAVADGSSSSASAPEKSISGYESFALDYRLHWPVNLIVSHIEILKYQVLFRYIFYCKHVERELEDCWHHHSQMKGALRNMPHSFVRSFSLRNRMMQFIRNILYYTVVDILEPNWLTLETAMRKAETIDEIMYHHGSFLDLSLTQNLLSNEKHLKVFKNIAETCISFATYTEMFSDLYACREPLDVMEKKLRERNYPATLAKFETSFDMHLGRLLDGLSAVSKKRANVHLANLCERLDVGGYYGRFKERTLASFGSLAI